MNRTPKFLAIVLITALVAGCTAPSPDGEADTGPYTVPAGTTAVSGSGATFPKPLLETWGIEFAKAHPTMQISYAGGGSGKGITDITNKDVVFGASDAPLSASEKANAPNILHIAETIGLNAIVYNVEGLSEGLKLDGATVGKIYLGEIDRWNHPDVAALNPGLSLPDKPITIVYRADSSGTTFVFTDWLVKTSSAWSSKMGEKPSKKPDWTKSTAAQLNGNGNDGVGSTVKSNPNTIGYVELAFQKSLNLDAALIKNEAGEFASPTVAGAQAAAGTIKLPAADGDWSKVSITDAAGEGVYPIASFSYVLVHKSISDYGGKASKEQLQAFQAWMYWALHGGQSYAEPLGYAPLPEIVVKQGETALQLLQL